MNNYQNPLSLGYYPFPETSIPAHVERLKKDAEDWLDNDYTFLTASERRLYKIANLAYTTIRMLPNENTSYERMKPAVRWMVAVTVSDDYYELSTREEIKHAAERVSSILLGADPLPDEMAFFHQYAIMRDEYQAFMPNEWMERMAKDMYEYLLFGIREMTAYTATGTRPNLAVYSIIQEFDVAVIPFMNFAECEIGFTLPKYVVDHPVIQRMRSLMGKIIGFQNDFYSLEKESVRGTSKVPCDLIRVMEDEYGLTFDEACKEALRFHDACVAEFVALQSALPDFGSINKDIENYALHMGIGIQGLNTWYHLDTLRYIPDGYQDIEKRDSILPEIDKKIKPMREELMVPKCHYRWPTVNSPIANAFDEEEKDWYDEDYTFISEEGIKRCKPQFLSRVATYMNPTCDSIERMRPCARLMIYITIFDDYFGMTPAKELKAMAERVYEVMMGEDPDPDEIGILRQMAKARKEWETFMPRFWLDRVAINFYEFIIYGMMEEIPFKQAEKRTYPLLPHYLNFRKYSIGMWPYGDLIDPATNSPLPNFIYNHPVLQRCRELLSLIIVIQNDFASLYKELEIESESLNIIFILSHQYQLTYQEACTEAMRLHDAYGQELDDLHKSLPDFGAFQQQAYDHIYHIKLQISGCANWYYNSGTNRYEPKGFIVPQYGREGDDILIPHTVFVQK